MPFKDPKSIAAIRSRKKENWKRNGIIFEDQFENVFNDYIKQTNCECCYKPFLKGSNKCIDHDHNNTTSYNVRGIVCKSCNQRREDTKWNSNTGERHIGRIIQKNLVYFQIQITVDNKQIFSKQIRALEDAIKIRDEFLKKNPWIYT